jgi:hypothetical protein
LPHALVTYSLSFSCNSLHIFPVTRDPVYNIPDLTDNLQTFECQINLKSSE